MPKKTTNDLISAQSSGLMSRLAYTYGKHGDANVAKLLKQSGLTFDDIHNVDVRISAQKQINFVELVAEEIDDPNFGFHLAREFDLRMGLQSPPIQGNRADSSSCP